MHSNAHPGAELRHWDRCWLRRVLRVRSCRRQWWRSTTLLHRKLVKLLQLRLVVLIVLLLVVLLLHLRLPQLLLQYLLLQYLLLHLLMLR